MADTPTPPYVTSTLSQVGSLATGVAKVAASGALNLASETLAKTIPNISHLTGASLSVANLANRLGSPAELMAGVASPATDLANKAASALGLGGGNAAGSSTAALAKTTFASGADDKIAALDVYTAKSAVTPVDVTSLIPKIDPAVTLKTMSSYLGAINSLVKDYSKLEKLKLNPSAIVSGLLSSNATIQAAFNSLPSTLKSAIVIAQAVNTDIGSLSKSLNGSVVVRNAGVTKVIANSSMKDVTSMVAMTSAITGGAYAPTITDKGSTAVVFGNIIRIAAAMQLPGAFSALIGALAPTPENVRMKGALSTLAANNAVSNGSLSLLSEIGKVAGSGTLVNKRNVLSSFGKNYSFSQNESTKDASIIGAKLRSAYSAINPTWNRSAQQPNAINALDDFLVVSTAMQSVIKAFTNNSSKPPVVKPQSVVIVPAAAGGDYVPPTGPGVTSTQVTNPDGSITHTISYPAQSCPAPQLDSTNIAFTGPPVPGAYTPPTPTISSSAVVEDSSTPNSIMIMQMLSDGTTQTVTKGSNGSQVTTHTAADGITTTTSLSTQASDAELVALFDTPGDPLVGTCYLATSDPIVATAAVQQHCDMDIADSTDSNTPALSSMGAADAISYSFPDANLSGLNDMTA